MSGKLVGAATLILACLSICGKWITEKRRAIWLSVEFASALERMEGRIRWQNLPLLRVLEQESEHHPCGGFFLEVCKGVKGGSPLHESWRNAFAAMSDRTARGLLCRLDLQGDARQIMGSLHLTAEELRSHAAVMSEKQRQSEQLCVAIGGCVTALLVIILI